MAPRWGEPAQLYRPAKLEVSSERQPDTATVETTLWPELQSRGHQRSTRAGQQHADAHSSSLQTAGAVSLAYPLTINGVAICAAVDRAEQDRSLLLHDCR